jgi:hypothetical protein
MVIDRMELESEMNGGAGPSGLSRSNNKEMTDEIMSDDDEGETEPDSAMKGEEGGPEVNNDSEPATSSPDTLNENSNEEEEDPVQVVKEMNISI